MDLNWCMLLGLVITGLIIWITEYYTGTNYRPVKSIARASETGHGTNVIQGLAISLESTALPTLVICAGIITAHSIAGLMGIAYLVSTMGFATLMLAPAVFAFGLVAFGFLGMGPVTIAVDSYGPVTDNAQSVYELSLIEQVPNVEAEVKKDFGVTANFDRAKHLLEENDGAGNTFKATAKPVLIGTAVVGATTMIFSIIQVLRGEALAGATRASLTEQQGLATFYENLSLLNPLFLLGLITGGAIIYWFTGASTQAVTTGAYRAVEFIKRNIKLDSGATKASITDSKKVVEICTQYAQKGMFNIFLVVFFSTLAFACLEPFFFIGYLISIALFGLFQAIFMANAGGAWDNAKKIVEVELKEKGTELHAATVVGDTVGDPFTDTSSVALNPVIKFTTLFGLLAVELAEQMKRSDKTMPTVLAAIFFGISVVFVYRSFYGMRIEGANEETAASKEKSAAAE
jgi:K(+)-stimulated pyrophosphate-energized sodium pump